MSNPQGHSVAVIQVSEVEDKSFVTWDELRYRVKQCSCAMRNAGVRRNDRVAGYVANHSNALVAMLASVAIGALWTAISPDQGVSAVLDRLEQIQPSLLFADSAVSYNGKVHQTQDKIKEIVSSLPQLKSCVVFDTVIVSTSTLSHLIYPQGRLVRFSRFVQDTPDDAPMTFEQLPADQPIYIVFSSGTTGKPKCISDRTLITLWQHY